jgi:EmrB/QacA subfamily drug resistance transporter
VLVTLDTVTGARTSGAQSEATAVTEAPERVNGNGAAPAAPARPTAPERVDTTKRVDTAKPAEQAPAKPAPAKPAPAQSDNSWIVPLAVLIVGMFMSVLDTSIVNVAIPKMQTALSASPDDIEWVVTGYTLVLGMVVPLSGWLGLRLGLTRLYVISMVGFALGSGLCGLAWNLDSMIAFRVLQAIPGGVLPVATMTLLFQIVPPARIGTAMGMYGLGVVVAPAIGPTLGGALVEYVDWRLIFIINVPIGILGTIAAVMIFPQIKPTKWPKLDLLGFLTIAYAMFALLLAFSEGEDWGWTGYRVLGLFVTAALSLGLFVIIENEVDSPLVDLRVFRSFPFCLSLILLSITITGLFSGLYFLPQFLQVVQGLQELDSGLVMLPAALVMVVLMPVAGRIFDLIGPRYPVMIGLAILAYGSYLMAGITVDTPRGDIEMWLAIRNVGIGLGMMPIMTAGVSSLPGFLTSAGSSVNNVMQRVSSSVAVAVFGSLNSIKGAQMSADQGALSGADSYAASQIGHGGQAEYLAAYQEMNAQVTTATYANGFFVVAIMGAIAAGLAMFMRSGKNKATAAKREPVEM